MKFIVIFSFFFASIALAQSQSLQDETMLHPLDSFTAFTLKKGEYIYSQPPLVFPLPGWAWIGVTDWMTVEFDALPLVGGFFVEPYKPVPSINFRFRLLDGGKESSSLAYETMYQYLYTDVEQSGAPNLEVLRRGASWYNRFNWSMPVSDSVWLHTSAGATYSRWLRIRNRNQKEIKDRTFENQTHPDFSLGIDWRYNEKMSVHATGSYGSTFIYLDNVPRKIQMTYGFRVTPYPNSPEAFWKSMRLEFAALFIHFPDADERMDLPVPILPYVYWQWEM